MFLPDYVRFCMDRLEKAGFAAYAVGGCVRDSLLGLTPHDFDLCTAALPEQTEEIFSDCSLVLAGKKHGTVAVVTDGGLVEITTFRTEGNYRDNRHPEWVEFVPAIEQDLARRDFTINAMAWSPTRGFADPFGGREDLECKILRAVGDPTARFVEDSLRILRGVRFAVKYGLTPDAATEDAMFRLVSLMNNLSRERVFDELCKLLVLVKAEDLLRFAPVLAAVIPELAPTIGFDQRSPHHAYDIYTHIAHVCEAVPANLALRWAALLHDVGKVPCFTVDENGRGHFYGHARESAKLAAVVLHELKAPIALRVQVVTLIEQHMTKLEPNRKIVRRRLSRLGEEMLNDLLTLQEADMGSKGTGKPEEMDQFPQIRAIIEELRAENACISIKDLAVNGHDLIQLGLVGPEIGQCLERLLNLVMDEEIPNEREALLAAAKSSK